MSAEQNSNSTGSPYPPTSLTANPFPSPAVLGATNQTPTLAPATTTPTGTAAAASASTTTAMPAPALPSSLPIQHSRSSLSARRLSESRPGGGISGSGRGMMGVGVSTSSPAVQHWNVPVSPNLSEAGGRAPSVSSALVDMEQEQEAQVNRLLGVIHWLQAYIADLQRRLIAETGDPSANVSVALEDVLTRVGRHPSATPRPVSISRQSSVSSYRGGGTGQGQPIGLSHSPSLAAQSLPTAPSMEALPASYNSTVSETVLLRRENETLKGRIKELERQLKSLQSAASAKDVNSSVSAVENGSVGGEKPDLENF